jgi:hypothetical protein
VREEDVKTLPRWSAIGLVATAAIAVLAPRATQAWQTTTPPFAPPTACGTPTPIGKSAIGLPEARAVAVNAEVWTLFFHPVSQPVTANRRVKIVWRMTGAGRFGVSAYSPDGLRVEPETGPDFHPSSNWARPGDEWGTWFKFPVAGCWNLHASRDNSYGDVWIEVK